MYIFQLFGNVQKYKYEISALMKKWKTGLDKNENKGLSNTYSIPLYGFLISLEDKLDVCR